MWSAFEGYRTVIFAVLVVVVGALQGMDWVHLLPGGSAAGWINTVLGMVMFFLRTQTTTPLGVSKSDTVPKM